MSEDTATQRMEALRQNLVKEIEALEEQLQARYGELRLGQPFHAPGGKHTYTLVWTGDALLVNEIVLVDYAYSNMLQAAGDIPLLVEKLEIMYQECLTHTPAVLEALAGIQVGEA